MKKKYPRKKKSTRIVENRQLTGWLAALCVLGALLVALVWLSRFGTPGDSTPPSASPPPVTVPSPPVSAPPSSPAPPPSLPPAVTERSSEVSVAPRIDELRAEIENALIQNGIRLQHYEVKPLGEMILFEVQSDFPGPKWVAALTRRLEGIAPEIRVQSDAGRKMIGVAWEGSRPFLIRFHPATVLPLPEPLSGKKRVAIIMDDLGRDRSFARELSNLPMAVTFSILPNEPHADWTARFAHQNGREVLIHLPMQPHNYPQANPGPQALMVDLSAQEILSRMSGHFTQVPHAVGGNNHMGSLFVEDRERMEVVLREMARRGLFFVDSMTSPRSTGYMIAKALRMPVAVRDVFLDNDRDVGRIRRQIDRLIFLAGKKGCAVGICHPYPETLKALRKSLDRFKAKGVEVVPVSQVLERWDLSGPPS